MIYRRQTRSAIYEGTLEEIEDRRGMFLIHIDQGDYVVFELIQRVRPGLGEDVAIGNRVSGPLHALGKTEITNVSGECRLRVYGQTGPSSLTACRRVMFR
ncbi:MULTISPECIES: hypothetical protein [Paraburkholderia]|uniref:Uncharacterized protein n=1 Tax=Paraburkholderia madseniana TaxID=2599607 RepID=A0AAP5BKZ5_9BURK|nr:MULTISPECIES: hypothetical protein [Paraburkholderia]MCX4151741.1 hypothetical protein [Paraburkholderia madseniana]MDN7154668.1 hypothetical protein [Paraburkholderia sp. WS6]MDQ6413551.1 hypothetical protein [Paraburkholderia madseniana]